MKLKLDENLPESLLQTLKTIGHDVDNVRIEGMRGQTDADVWRAAQKAERFLITQDLDFSDIRQFSPGTHYGLMLVRLRAPGRFALAARIADAFRAEGGVLGALFRFVNRPQAARQSTINLSPRSRWNWTNPSRAFVSFCGNGSVSIRVIRG